MNILLDTACPACKRTATLELKADASAHDVQQLDIIVECHSCGCIFNQFVCIDEMEVCGE